MLSPLRCRLDRAYSPLDPQVLDIGRSTQQPSKLRSNQVRASAGLVQGLETSAQTVAGEQSASSSVRRLSTVSCAY
jgi:hypothetical protein